MRTVGTEMDDDTQSGFTLERAWFAVRRRARLVGLISGSIIGGAALLCSTMSVRYEASATVQVEPRKKAIANPSASIDAPSGVTADSEIEIIRSRAVINKVIDRLNLRSDPEFTEPSRIKKLIRSVLGGQSNKHETVTSDTSATAKDDAIARIIAGETPAIPQGEPDEIAQNFADQLAVVRVRMTQMFEIRFTSKDPAKAAKIANAIVAAYFDEQIEQKRRSEGMTSSIIEARLVTLRTRVAEAEARVEQFKAENNLFDSGTGENLNEKQIALQIEKQVNAKNETAAARAKYEQVRKLLTSGEGFGNMTDMLDSANIAQLKEAYSRAQRRRAELETRYGPKHPELQKAKAEVSEAAAQLSAEFERYAVKLKNDYEVAAERERQLSAGMTAFKEQQIVAKQASVKLKELQREAQTEKELFESILASYKQANESQNLQLPDSRVIEIAEVPLKPSAPNRLRIMLIAIFGGLGAGIGLALALEFLNSGISRPEDVEHSLELNLLSSLPAVRQATERQDDFARPARLVFNEPHSVFAEAIRGIRREIDQRRVDDAPRIILVVSGLPGEGSELIASNLAHHFALTGNRILLVDGDLRRSNLTRRLGAPRSGGLHDVLNGGMPADRAVLRDTVTGLHFLSAGGGQSLTASMPELLASARMTQAIEALKQQFDTIVIDAPPLLPVVDGRILADYADQIVYVTNWRRTPTQLSKRAIKSLGPNQEKVAGVVVNEVDPAILSEAHGYAIDGNGPGSLKPRYAA